MRSVRSALVGLGTLTILLTFVGFAMFSPDDGEARPETAADQTPTPIIMAADAGTTTGRVTAFVFANQLQGQIQPTVQTELTIALLVEQGRKPLSVTTTTTTTAPPTTTTAPRRVTTTTKPPAPTTTSPPATTTTTSPPVTTTSPPSSGPLTAGEMRALVEQYFPESEWDKAVLVARCESNYDPSAYNPAGPFGGLYQHSLAYWSGRAASAGWAGASIYDAAANTAVTAWLWNQGGWGHWPWCSAWADAQLGG
jgi:hypothetical protein